MLRKVTVLGLWCACSAVLRAKRVCVKTNMPEIVVFTVPSTCLYTVVPRYHEPLVKSVLRAKRVCVKTNMPEIVVFTVPSTCLYTVVPRYHEPLVKSRFHCITP